MLQYLLDNLIKFFPQAAGYSFVTFVVAILVWKVCSFYLNTKKTVGKFPQIETVLAKIDKGLTTLNQVLLEKQIISQSCYSSENSPRVINEKGMKLCKDSGAEEIFNDVKDELLKELEKKPLTSLLELERTSLDVFLERMNDPRFKKIQDFAFENPRFEGLPLTYTDILFILALKLRDYYRENHSDFRSG